MLGSWDSEGGGVGDWRTRGAVVMKVEGERKTWIASIFICIW